MGHMYRHFRLVTNLLHGKVPLLEKAPSLGCNPLRGTIPWQLGHLHQGKVSDSDVLPQDTKQGVRLDKEACVLVISCAKYFCVGKVGVQQRQRALLRAFPRKSLFVALLSADLDMN